MKEKRTTHEIRKQLGMTSQEFADRFKIPVGTVRNWDTRGTMPAYIEFLIREIIDISESSVRGENKNGYLQSL